ncbi:MAG: alpha-amylase family glycosyl hydrolase [Myxococcota bacterium]
MSWIAALALGCHAPTSATGGPSSTDDATDGPIGSWTQPTSPTTDGSTGGVDTAATTTTTPPAVDVPFEQRAIYLVMPDRFANGDPTNDGLGVPNCVDPANPVLFHGGDWLGLEQHLDYLEELGVDAVWITPPYQQVPPTVTSCGYHGYWGDFADPDDGAVEPKLGTVDDLASLADALHARGMVLVLDLVPNHSGRGSRILAQHPDWFHDDADCAGSDQPDIDCSLNGLPDFDQELPEVDAYLRAQSVGWVERARADAIRIDTVKHVPPDWLGGSWLPEVTDGGARFAVGEIFDEGGYDRIEDYVDAGLPSAFDFPLRRALVDAVAHGGSIDLVASRVAEAVDRFGIDQANRMVHLVDNHDVQRFTEDVLHRPDEEATGRYRMALAILTTAPGIPQLQWGDELGMRGGNDPDNRRDLPAWAFDPATRTGDPDGFLPDVGGTFDATRALLALRKAHPALTVGGYTELWRYNNHGAQVWAYFRSSGEDRVIVAIHAGTGASGPLSIKIQENPGLDAVDLAAMPDGVALTPILSTSPARIEGGKLVIDDLPPLTATAWVVGP